MANKKKTLKKNNSLQKNNVQQPIPSQTSKQKAPIQQQIPTQQYPLQQQIPTQQSPFQQQIPTQQSPLQQQIPSQQSPIQQQIPTQLTSTDINSNLQLNIPPEQLSNNSKKKLPISSQIVKTNPFSQTEELTDNIKQIKKNIETIINISAPLIEKTTSMTCDIAKKISDTVCNVNNYLNSNINKIKNSYNMLDESVSNSMNKIQNLNESINLYGGGGGYIKPKVSYAKQKISYTKQNIDNKNKYQYIINPITNRKVNIYTKLGTKIIHNYLKKTLKQ